MVFGELKGFNCQCAALAERRGTLKSCEVCLVGFGWHGILRTVLGVPPRHNPGKVAALAVDFRTAYWQINLVHVCYHI